MAPNMLDGEPWDVVVIGAGIAGVSAAIHAANSGYRTLLVEAKSFPREKVCGGCLNQRAQQSLYRLGIGLQLADFGAVPLNRLELRVGRFLADWEIPPIRAICRSTLDAALVEQAVRLGVAFVDGTKARLLDGSQAAPRNRKHAMVALERPDGGQQTIVSRFIVAADGLTRSCLPLEARIHDKTQASSRIGVQAIFPRDRYRPSFPPASLQMLVDRIGYVGVSPCDGERLKLAAAIDPLAVARLGGPAAAVEQIMRSTLRTIPAPLSEVKWMATSHLTRNVGVLAGYRWLSIGDASGYIEPFTGEGMAWAMEDAEHAVEWMQRAVEGGWNNGDEIRWKDKKIEVSKVRRRRCAWIAAQLRHPMRAEFMLRVLNTIPPIRNHLIEKILV